MRKFITTLIISTFLFVTPSVMAEEVLLPKIQHPPTPNHKTLTKLHSVVCETEECDIYQTLSTTKTCVDAFEKYFKKSGGSLPACIPNFRDEEQIDPFPRDELLCYANVRLNVREDCNPIYDPTVDVFGVINESNIAPTPYEICLKNQSAVYDVCMLALDLYCVSDCNTQYRDPCYDEFEITGDQAALDTCLADAQPLSDQCVTNQCHGDSYLFPNKTCIGDCWSQYPTDTVPCYEEYEITGDQDALNECIANAELPFDQCVIDECGGDQRIYPGYIIVDS